MFYPYEGYRLVTPLDAARVNRTIFNNRSVHWYSKYYITLVEGRDYVKHDIIVSHGQQNPHFVEKGIIIFLVAISVLYSYEYVRSGRGRLHEQVYHAVLLILI